MENSYGVIDIGDIIAIDKSEYDSYEEAAITAEMLSLQNIRVEEHGGKYKLVSCSDVMDFSGRHLKAGDKVQYGLYGTCEIVDIGRCSTDHDHISVTIQIGKDWVCLYGYANKEGQYIFNNLKIGEANAEYIVSNILTDIRYFLHDYGVMIAIGVVILLLEVRILTLVSVA